MSNLSVKVQFYIRLVSLALHTNSSFRNFIKHLELFVRREEIKEIEKDSTEIES